MQTDAEHQQDHADLGEFPGEMLIGDEARREGAGEDAGEQIPHQRRDSEPDRNGAEDESEAEAGDDRRYERRIV